MDQVTQLAEELERWKKLAVEAIKQTQSERELYGGRHGDQDDHPDH